MKRIVAASLLVTTAVALYQREAVIGFKLARGKDNRIGVDFLFKKEISL